MASDHRVKRGEIARLLIAWYNRGHRDLPWRKTADPYRVWVSEIMLQQTRAQAVVPYFERFLARFPTVESLARAKEAEALALWSGLGYYSRARNLLRAARTIHEAGAFPADYAALRALPGVGDYTAAAVASIAFGLPHAAVDGNVLRVVARVQNDAAEIGAARTRARFREIAQEWLDPRRSGAFNQALMELGATVCLPRNPACHACPLAQRCAARAAGTAERLPVKLRKTEVRRIEGVLLVVRKSGRVLLAKGGKGAARVEGFWEMPSPEDLPEVRVGARLAEFRHAITFHRYTLRVHRAAPRSAHCAARGAPEPPGAAGAELRWFGLSGLGSIPLSTTARKALEACGLLSGRGAGPRKREVRGPR
jgi:A/G-specific adenine glycosylase